MGVSQSKQSTINSSPLSFLDRKKKLTNQSKTSTSNKLSTTSLKRLSLLRGSAKMEKRETLEGSHHKDFEIAMDTEEQRAETMTSSRRSSRRRTRSIALTHQDEVADEDNEPVTSRRIRRRMKGKSRQIEGDFTDDKEESFSETKGKMRQAEEIDNKSTPTEESTEHVNAIDGSPRPSPIAHSTSRTGEEEAQSRPLPPVLDPPLSSVSSGADFQGEQLHPTSASLGMQSSSSTSNPFDLSSEERTRARAQIAQALGVGAASPLADSWNPVSTLSNRSRPSMLSALLTDILGLRSGQAGTSDATTGSRSHGTNLGGRDSSRPRSMNGGTSVIVQGALISRTLPSRPNTTTNNTSNPTVSQRPNEDSATLRRSQSQPPASMDANVANATSTAPSSQESTLTPEGETQVATIEEQAAMLIRLLSIATAATAASLVSRPSPHQSRRQGGGMTSRDSNTTLRQSPSTTTPTQTGTLSSHATANALPASPSTISSNSASSSWRQASQTYQVLRERFSALRSRFRGQRAATRAEEVETVSPEQANNNSSIENTDTTLPVTEEGGAQGRIDEDASGSLNSLSSMLQDAIRDGVQSSERGSRATERQSSSQVTSTGEGYNNQARSVHATLDAVRGGQLSRGEAGSFDRFLFDLMSDLDIAVRGLPRDRPTDNETSEARMDDMTRSRRERDMHDGQLSFFRLFTFPAPSTNEQTPVPNELLPCVVVGVRSLEAHQVLQGERETERSETATSTDNAPPSPSSDGDVVMQDESIRRITTAMTEAATNTDQRPPTQDARPMSRFLLFVSGGHYPPQHPLFHSSTDEASRDLMVLMEFLGAMASMHAKPNTTVTKDQIEKSKLRMIVGGLEEISRLVKEKEIMENTSERCLICLEDWKDEGEDRRLLECAHLFHAPCIDQWLTASNNSCPLCRRQAVQIPGAPSPATVPSIPLE